MTQHDLSAFEQAAAKASEVNLAQELWGFLKVNKKWWLLPIVVMMGVFSLLILLSGTGVAPIVYTLF